MDYGIPNPDKLGSMQLTNLFEECELHRVLFDYERDEFTVVLMTQRDQSIFVVQTGYLEACLIYRAAHKARAPGPVTHELFGELIHSLGGSMREAVVDGFDPATRGYKCHLAITTINGLVRVMCRVSDAVAISLYCNAAVKVDRVFLGKDLQLAPS